MGFCFVCDIKLFGERTRVCSSVTQHSNVPYPEKIVELLGDEFVVIVTPADHMCKRCSSLINHMDKLENDLKLVKKAMLSYIQKKYGLLPADQPIKSIEVVNGQLKMDDLEVGQRRVPSGLTFRAEPSSSSTPAVNKRQQDSKMKIYKCGFCSFQSKDLGHVRFHMRTHMENKNAEKSKQTVPKITTLQPQLQQQKQQQQKQQQQKQQQQQLKQQQQFLQPRKRLYRCQVCSASFDSKVECLDHIQKDHNQQPSSTTNEGKSTVTSEVFKPDLPMLVPVVDNQQAEINKDVNNAINSVMVSNGNIPNGDTAHNVNSEIEDGCGNISRQELGGMLATNADVGDMATGGNETEADDLDLESLLAEIHNDPPMTEDREAQILQNLII